jgi:hypothetical protein
MFDYVYVDSSTQTLRAGMLDTQNYYTNTLFKIEATKDSGASLRYKDKYVTTDSKGVRISSTATAYFLNVGSTGQIMTFVDNNDYKWIVDIDDPNGKIIAKTTTTTTYFYFSLIPVECDE